MEEKKKNGVKMNETIENEETSFTPSPVVKKEISPHKPANPAGQKKQESTAKAAETSTLKKKVEEKEASKPVEKELAAKSDTIGDSEKPEDKPKTPTASVVKKADSSAAPVIKKSENSKTPDEPKAKSPVATAISKKKPEEKQPVSDEKVEASKPKDQTKAKITKKPENGNVKPDKVTVTAGDEAKGITRNNRQKRIAASPIQPQEASILVVEDNVVNFRLFARLLGYMGVFEYEWKTSGWQVAEFASTMKRIDLVLLDIRLPYEDGFEVIKKLRETKNLKNTLIIAITAEASVEQMKRAQEAEFDGFIGKPIDPDKFPGQIRRILSGEPVWEIH